MDKNLVWILTCIANIGTLYLTYLTATAKLTDGRKSGFVRKLKSGGRIFILCGFVLIAIQALSAWLTDKIDDEEREKLISKFDSSAEKIQKTAALSVEKFQNSSNEAALDITKALAKYNLKYDSTQGAIVKLIKDSSQKTTIINTSKVPTLEVSANEICDGISYLGFIDGRDKFQLCYQINNAPLIPLNIRMSAVNMDSTMNKYFHLGFWENILDSGIVLTDNRLVPKYWSVRQIDGFLFIAFWTRGLYTDVSNTNRIHFDEITFYNRKTGHKTIMQGKTAQKMRSYIDSIELKFYNLKSL